ncbi:class II aldolase/adducin family protein [Amycolatopsis suaedae]|uniref:Class II aldolase/adducin family protein n=1 Tax=Amycolatopsis suaedae TaxID=2510978 RepID=A0A4Q7J2U6_9PSEU|nr:class II aldolase/adducin family protein [Amycolatopsis suaedae]RZQ61088.1 class II aldolase/adducin family protein [Amycolatopsis suaedae]
MTGTLSHPVAQERVYRRQRLAAALRLFARYGFDEGAGGHITARDPGDPDRFWINPFAVHFGHIRASDLLLVDADGTVVEGDGRVNPAGFAIHSQIHHARPDVVAVAHAHSTYGRAFATLGVPLAPITQDACAFHGDHAVFDGFDGVVLESEEGRRIAERLGTGKAVILRNHGLLTVGGSVQEAAWWFITMDSSCRVQLLAQAAGTPVPVAPEAAEATARTMGTPEMGRLNFRPLYADIVRAEPDLLD